MKEKVLVSLSYAKSVAAAPDCIRELTDRGWEVAFNPLGRVLTEGELLEQLAGVSGVIAGSDHYTARAIDEAMELRVIARVGVGFDSVDLEAATRRGVMVTTSPVEEVFVAVAEHTIGLMLAVSRQMARLDHEMKAGRWLRAAGPHLSGCILGVIGLGRIGLEVARLAQSFRMKVLCYDVVESASALAAGLTYVGLHQLLRESDFVTLHAPLTPETRNLLDRETLSMMKPSAYLINTSRGAIVDEGALHWALTNGVIAGAALDVFSREPVSPDNLLVGLENLLAIPHMAGLSTQAMDATFASATRAVIDALEGRQPFRLMNPEVLRVVGRGFPQGRRGEIGKG